MYTIVLEEKNVRIHGRDYVYKREMLPSPENYVVVRLYYSDGQRVDSKRSNLLLRFID
jgi:hypothetical protein